MLTANHRSSTATWYSPWGDAAGDRFPRHPSTLPYAEASTTCSAEAWSAASINGASINCPVPVRSRSTRASRTARTECIAANMSTGPCGSSLGPSGWPVRLASPPTCSMVMAKPTRSLQGPSSPNAGARRYTARGLRPRMASQVTPHESITRGLKFSMTTSAVSRRVPSTSCPASVVRSSATRVLPGLAPW